MLSPYRELIKSIREKNEFLKNISKDYIKMRKKFIQFFQDKSLGKKKAPAGSRRAKKKKFLKNISKGDIKKASAKGTEKKRSWMVSIYRPWQDPIGQGHGEWNGNRERLYGMAMGLPGAHRPWPERTGHGQNSQK